MAGNYVASIEAELGLPAAAAQRMISLAPPRPAVTTTFAARHNCAFWAALESAG